MKKIVFATCKAFPDFQPSDLILAQALGRLETSSEAAVWNGAQEPFAEADLVLIRSTWDYQQTPQAFEDWLLTLAARVRVINPPGLMRWNLSKRYLVSLSEQGAPLPSMRFVDPVATSIAAAMDELGLIQAVVKPEYGATASGLSLVSRDDATGLAEAARNLAMRGIVQPLLPEITTRGETSFMFFAGEFSHAVTKRPKQGEIRCQSEYGGVVELINPPDWAIKKAGEILPMLPELPIYARIDAIMLDETLQLMEVELIEPELFFTYCPKAADRCAAAILKYLS